MKHNVMQRLCCFFLTVGIIATSYLVYAKLPQAVAAEIGVVPAEVSDSQGNIENISVAQTGASLNPVQGATGCVNDDYVNLRKGAGTNTAVLTCMRKNTRFTFVDAKLYNSSWYKIKLASGLYTGYIRKDFVTVLSVPSNPETGTQSGGYISSDYVNLRKGAGTNTAVVTCMRINTKFTFVDNKLYNSEWYKIKLTSSSYTGYVRKDFVKVTSNSPSTPPSDTSSVKGYVNADNVNLRKGAGMNYAVVTSMSKNTQFTFISTKLYNSQWYNIKLDNGKIGYIFSQYASKKSTGVTTPTNPTTKPTEITKPAETTKPSTGKITLSDTSETIYVGNNYAITAKGVSSVSWTSSNTSVATVDSNGVVTAKASGTANITAKSGSNSAVCKITVKSGSYVNISQTSIDNMRNGKSVLLKSTTSSVSWKSSNTSIATVNNGVVDTKSNGYVTITAYTSSGAASCLIKVIGRDNIRFTYASPNSAPKNSTVTFKTITDTDRIAVRFVVSNGSTSYTVNANKKEKDGNTYIWSGTYKLSTPGKWTVKAYSKYKTSNSYLTTPGAGEGEVFVTASTDKTTTVCSERRASDEVIDLIANYEGFLTEITADYITSDPTLGYGKVILTNEQFYNHLTKNEAYAYLCQTVNKGGYTTKTNAFLLDNGIKFNQQQFDSLVCFAYNVGASAIYNDSDLQSVLLNTGSAATVSAGASGYVSDSGVNLRSGPGTSYAILANMSYQTKITFVDGKVYNTNWYKIKLSDGTIGYVHKAYVSPSGSSAARDLDKVNKQNYLSSFLQYHHAAGSCYWGLLYRRIDEAEVFFHADYVRDGQYNKKGLSFTCSVYPSFSIG